MLSSRIFGIVYCVHSSPFKKPKTETELAHRTHLQTACCEAVSALLPAPCPSGVSQTHGTSPISAGGGPCFSSPSPHLPRPPLPSAEPGGGRLLPGAPTAAQEGGPHSSLSTRLRWLHEVKQRHCMQGKAQSSLEGLGSSPALLILSPGCPSSTRIP